MVTVRTASAGYSVSKVDAAPRPRRLFLACDLPRSHARSQSLPRLYERTPRLDNPLSSTINNVRTHTRRPPHSPAHTDRRTERERVACVRRAAGLLRLASAARPPCAQAVLHLAERVVAHAATRARPHDACSPQRTTTATHQPRGRTTAPAALPHPLPHLLIWRPPRRRTEGARSPGRARACTTATPATSCPGR